MCKLNLFDKLSFLIVLIGSFDLSLAGLFDINLFQIISIGIPQIEKTIYILVCAAAVNLIFLLFRCGIFTLDD
ncbi:MAG: DUF378 domain-containing protein [Clostridium sp.]